MQLRPTVTSRKSRLKELVDERYTPMSERNITLYCRESGSDKVYRVELLQRDGGWVVNGWNGGRGKALKMQPKTDAPVSLAEANKVYDDLVKAKQKKGYHEGEEGQAYSAGEFAGRASGHRPQLPTAVNAQQAAQLMQDDEWGLQEKMNGERRPLLVEPGGTVRGINKLGLFVPVPAHWTQAFAGVAADGGCLVEGEHIGDELHVFDVLSIYGNDIRDRPLAFRMQQLDRMLAHHGAAGLASVVKPVRLVTGAQAKIEAAAQIEAARGEGFVLKHLASPYDTGRSLAAYKHKFNESSTCIVMGKNAQRSVLVGLLTSDGEVVGTGNVSIPLNHAIPSVGELVEVQYLYYNPVGAFEQPVYLGKRGDILRDECNFGQVMRLKPGTEMPEELWAGDRDAEAPPERMRA